MEMGSATEESLLGCYICCRFSFDRESKALEQRKKKLPGLACPGKSHNGQGLMLHVYPFLCE